MARIRARSSSGVRPASAAATSTTEAAAVEAAGGIDIAALPTELRPAAEAIVAAKRSLETPPDPIDGALAGLNQALRSMKAPSLEQQLEALGVEAAPELGVAAEQVPQPQEA